MERAIKNLRRIKDGLIELFDRSDTDGLKILIDAVQGMEKLIKGKEDQLITQKLHTWFVEASTAERQRFIYSIFPQMIHSSAILQKEYHPKMKDFLNLSTRGRQKFLSGIRNAISGETVWRMEDD